MTFKGKDVGETRPSETRALLSPPNPWDGEQDPRNPNNWSKARKAAILGLVSFAGLNDSLGATMITPAVPRIVGDFQSSSPSVAALLISVHVIGFALGPLIVSPACELYGRNPLMHISNFMFLFATLMCALSTNMIMLIIARFMTGMAGCIPTVLEGGYIADLIPVGKRGRIMAIWALGPLLGSVIGPIIGGYLTLNAGWRWAFWSMVIVSGAQAAAGIFCLKETFVPVILQRKNATRAQPSLSKELSPFWTAFVCPAKLATRSPIVIISALHITIAYVYFYFIVTTFPTLFGDHYGFNSGQIGLVYISPALGYLVGMITFGSLSDWYLERRQYTNGMSDPEDRLFSLFPGNILIAVGMMWYGWSIQIDIHWIMPLAGVSFVTIGISGVFLAIQPYLTDSFGVHVAHAIAVSTVVRSIFGGLLPLTGPSLYSHLGYGLGNTLLGLLALIISPTALLFFKYGGKLRTDPNFHVL